MNLKIKTGESSKKNSLKIAFLLYFLISVQFVFAQNQTIDLNMTDKSLSEIFKSIEKQADISVDFDETQINIHQKISVNIKNKKLTDALSMILSPLKYKYAIQGKHVIITNEKNRQKSESIVGFVKNPNGEPLIGASVLVKGTNNAVSTDIDGRFHIKATPKSRLVVSYVGHNTQEIAVTPGITMNIELSEKANIMDEVVVVGYGTQKKANLIGAVGYTDHKQLEKRPVNNLGQALQGAIPNLNISYGSGKPGEKTRMNVRGFASINQESKPLILIDGMEGNIDKINPRDVESISVLKDASSAAIYGARAPFGVVLITTKKGESGKTQVNYNGRFSFSKPTTRTDFLTTGYDAAMLVDEFMRSYNGVTYTRFTSDDYKELVARRFDKTENPERPWTVVQNRGGVESYMYYANFDWYNYLFDQSRPTWDHNLSISGGNQKINYLLSGNYGTQDGIYRQNTDKLRTANLLAKVSADAYKWLTVKFMARLYDSKYTAPGVGHGYNIPSLTFHAMPYLMPYNPDGTWVYQNPIQASGPSDGIHILIGDGTTKSIEENRYMTYSWSTIFKIMKGLTFTANYNFKHSTTDYMERSTQAKYSQYPGVEEVAQASWFSNKLIQEYEKSFYHSVDAYLNYDNTFNSHHVYAVAGFNYEQNHYKHHYATKLNIQSDELNDFNLGEKGKDVTVQGGQSKWALLGYFGRIGYDYAGKYLAEFNIRWDASSRFPKDHRAGLFPSFAVGYRMSEESFFDPIRKVFSNFKIRLSTGSLGNQAISDCYPYIQKLNMQGLGGYLMNGEPVTYAAVSAPPSGKLTWETVIHHNLGLDLGFFDNRLNLSADLFIRDTKDMLVPGKMLPGVYGATPPKENAADLHTKGFELAVSWYDQFNLGNKPFSYNLSFGLSDSKSVITKFDNPMKEFAKSSYYEGMTIGEIWGYKIDGLFQTDEEAAAYAKAVDNSYVCENIFVTAVGDYKGLQAGDPRYVDIDGSGRIDDGEKTADNRGDMVIIGNKEPRYLYNANIGLSWNGIDISAFFQGVGRQHRYPDGNNMMFWGGFARPYSSFVPANFLDNVWSEENPDAYLPKIRGYAAQGNRSLAHKNDRYLQNIAYCRLKNLTVGYTLPTEWTSKIKLDRLRVYFSGDNLFTWTKLKSDYIDPEQITVNSDARTYPFSKVFSFGLDITF